MKKLLFATVIAMAIFACNSTQVTSSWKASDVTLKQYNKILVAGMAGAKDRDIRESVENAMANSLKERGFNAVTSWSQYGPKVFDQNDQEKAVEKVTSDGFDGAFVISLLDKQKERNYYPGSYYYSPYWGYYNNFYWSYNFMYNRLYDPGYYTTTTNYVLEVNFYDVAQRKLLYSAQTKSFDPGSAGKLATDFSKTVIDDMIKAGIIAK
ncbi:hypothetical protein LX64_00572 [Chitinophaga skermanii]|uniref:DUF4136 domain-containing protein n=1 Tax=Chitinophaga skermanii TaxID=331697 RepID=A0A327R427_9BACT|nr:hypothetical protein [Chitinophaga skermanii]RAJ10965.1 hypothetical protein LX64_00572 [Chitinophaga skermanii]